MCARLQACVHLRGPRVRGFLPGAFFSPAAGGELPALARSSGVTRPGPLSLNLPVSSRTPLDLSALPLTREKDLISGGSRYPETRRASESGTLKLPPPCSQSLSPFGPVLFHCAHLLLLHPSLPPTPTPFPSLPFSHLLSASPPSPLPGLFSLSTPPHRFHASLFFHSTPLHFISFLFLLLSHSSTPMLSCFLSLATAGV